MTNKSILLIILIALSLNSFSQALSYSDPAAAYLKVMLDKSEGGTYQQIGNFKVIGTSYLYGEKLKGSAYAGNEKSENTFLSYNMYNQQLDIYLNDSKTAISKPANQVDSFTIDKSSSQFINAELLFYSSRLLESNIKSCFLQVVYKGDNFSLFKAYSSTLDYVSTNYIQSELRQFTIEYNYYYYNKATKTLKKLKLSKRKIIEEFSPFFDASSFLNDDDFNNNPENSLKLIFNKLNQK